jgi:hypothetical protein
LHFDPLEFVPLGQSAFVVHVHLPLEQVLPGVQSASEVH